MGRKSLQMDTVIDEQIEYSYKEHFVYFSNKLVEKTN